MTDTEVTSQETTSDGGAELDALYDTLSARGNSADIPMEAPAKPVQQATPEIEFTANGKQIKAPITDPRIKQWAAQGYDYQQKMQDWNQKEKTWQTKLQEYETRTKELTGRYGELDAYTQKNPAFWQKVQNLYAQENALAAGIDPESPLLKEISSVKNELNEIKQFKESILTEKQTKQREAEDAALSNDIKSMREQYKHLDFEGLDENGKNLEYRVLEFAKTNNIGSYSAAFKAFNHEQLLKHAAESAKEAVAKDIQKKTKLGLLGTSSTPKKPSSDGDYKNKTYAQLFKEGFEDSAN